MTISDDATLLPVSLELRNARIHAARALRRARRRGAPGLAAGAARRDPAVPERGAPVGQPARAARPRSGYEFPPLRPPARRRRSAAPLVTPRALVITLARRARSPSYMPERLERRARPPSARRSRTRSPRRSATASCCTRRSPASPRATARTVGRPWILGPMAVFNLLGLPADRGPARARTSAACRSASRSPPARGRDHVAIAVALELERAFGGWVPPPRPRSGRDDGGGPATRP